jgi:hypothetical protein
VDIGLLPKKRRRTEVSVHDSGSGGAIGWHSNTLKKQTLAFGCRLALAF